MSEAPANTDPNTAPSTGTAPPAADIVNNGRSLREIELEKELEAQKTARKKAETDASYAQDEARRLKEIQSQAPAPQKQKKSGWGFYGEED